MPLRYSNNEKINENKNIKEIFFSAKGPVKKIANPKNKERNRGINIREKIIKLLNVSSCVNEIEIQ